MQNAADGYEFWRSVLAGEPGPIDANEPQFGFYLRRFKSRPPNVIAIFPADGANWAVEVDRQGKQRALPWVHDPSQPNVPSAVEMWPYIATRAISEDAWRYYQQHGRLPEEVEDAVAPPQQDMRAGVGHNLPPDVALIERLVTAAEACQTELMKGVTDQLSADRAANHRDHLIKLRDEADAMRKEQKRPHMEAAKAVDDRWRDVITTAENAITFARNALTPFLAAQKAAAEKAAPGAETKPRAGTGKRRTGLTTVKSAEVVDYEAAALALLAMDNRDLKAEIERLATKIYAAGGELPGCKLHVEEKAR